MRERDYKAAFAGPADSAGQLRRASPELQHRRAVLFDLDDTLFDHRHSSRHGLVVLRRWFPALRQPPLEIVERAHADILEQLHQRVVERKLNLDQARLQRFARLLREFGGVRDRSAAARAAEMYRAAYLRSRRPVSGAVSVLARLARMKPDIAIGIVSNNILAEQVDKLRCCGLDRYIDAMVVSEEAGASKPDPAIFDIALKRIRCARERTVMVGDSWANDIVGARRAGIRAIWFNWRRRPIPQRCPDVAEIRALAELPELLF